MEYADKLRRKNIILYMEKMVASVHIANVQVCFVDSACLVQGHSDLGRLDRSLKAFHPQKQSDLSWRNISQHWAVRDKSYFFTSKYSLCARQAVLHGEFSPWTSSAVQAQVLPGCEYAWTSLNGTGTKGEGVVGFPNQLFLLLGWDLQLIYH